MPAMSSDSTSDIQRRCPMRLRSDFEPLRNSASRIISDRKGLASMATTSAWHKNSSPVVAWGESNAVSRCLRRARFFSMKFCLHGSRTGPGTGPRSVRRLILMALAASLSQILLMFRPPFPGLHDDGKVVTVVSSPIPRAAGNLDITTLDWLVSPAESPIKGRPLAGLAFAANHALCGDCFRQPRYAHKVQFREVRLSRR